MGARTITGLGLPLRTELRLKSLLAVIGSRTSEQWTFCDDVDADVALCDPDSALAARALRNGGRQRVVFVVPVDAPADAQRTCLHHPVRPAELIDLLNELSAELPPRAAPTGAEPFAASAPRFAFGVAVRGLVERGAGLVRLEAGGVVFYLDAAAATVHAPATLLDETLHAALRDGPEPAVRDATAAELAADACRPLAVDELLWSAGLHARGGLVRTVPADAAVKLSRWPDFGRFEYQDLHLRMAARLTRAHQRLPQLAAALPAPVDEVTAFVNACALCGLLEIQRAERARGAAPTAPAAAPAAAKLATASPPLLRLLRSALGLRT